MTSSLYISNPFTKSRQCLQNIDLQKNVGELKTQIATVTNIQVFDQEVIYCGECLEDHNTLQSYSIRPNATLFVKEKIKENQDSSETRKVYSIEEIDGFLKKLKGNLFVLKKYVKDKTKMEELIASVSNEDQEFLLKAFVSDGELLLNIIDTSTPESIQKTYPGLVDLLQGLCLKACVHIPPFPNLPDVDMEGGDYEGIDPANLAQAEMLASGEEAVQQQANSSRNTSQQQQRPQFSASDLASALSFATTLTPDGERSSSSSTPSESQTEEALVQMRNVGITDDALSRRALQMAAGNVEAAINLIFEGTLS